MKSSDLILKKRASHLLFLGWDFQLSFNGKTWLLFAIIIDHELIFNRIRKHDKG